MWLAGARPRTLPAAVVPVAVGTAAATLGRGDVRWGRAVLALLVSLALQLGVNFSNDYSDGIRGTDDVGVRVGPPRLVGWRLVSPKSVKRAAFAAFAFAAVAGLGLAAVTSWWLIIVGVAAIAAAWFYTGGPHPYGYAGLGEVFVFTFFGLVAVAGSAYVQHEQIPRVAWPCGIAIGLLAVSLLVTNNLRDIPGDSTVGKRTLAVRIGDIRTRWFFGICLVLPFLLVPFIASLAHRWLVLLALLALFAAVDPVRRVWSGAAGRELIAVLGSTARVQLIFGVLLTVGLWSGARHVVPGQSSVPSPVRSTNTAK